MYRIQFTRAARRALAGLPRKDLRAVDAAVLGLAEDPRPAGCQKIKGSEDLLRIRAGSYRVIYRIEDDALVVLVIRVGHRREVYRGL